jgi:hypothetical protein
MFTTGFIVTSADKDGLYYVDNMNLPFTGIKMHRCIQCIEGGVNIPVVISITLLRVQLNSVISCLLNSRDRK